MTCPREAEVIERFAGTLDEARAEAVALHLAECALCRATTAELEAVTTRLAPDDGEFEDPELARDVGTLIKLGRTPRTRRRAGWMLAPAIGLAAALAIIFLVPPPTHEFAARTAAVEDADRWVSIEVFRVRAGETGYERVEADVSVDDALLFSLHNGPESPYRYAMILAIDARGESFWYHPAYQEAGQDPVSIDAPATQKPRPLREAVRHPFEPGWLRVVALFSRAPLRVSEVEKAVRAEVAAHGVSDLDRLPIEGTGQQSFLLRVAR